LLRLILKEEMKESMNSIAVAIEITKPVGEGVGTINAGETSNDEIQAHAELIKNEYLVSVDSNAPGCCIDGRPCAHHSEPRAKVAGGPLITAYGALESIGYFDGDERSTEQKMQSVATTLTQGGIVLGGHGDAAAAESMFSEDKTGCGANDKLPEIIANIGRASEFIEGNTEYLMGDTYKPELAKTQVQHSIENPISDWKALYMLAALGGTDEAKDNGKVEVLKGGHTEIMAIVNYIEATTVDRDRMLADGEPQVFVVDAWYIAKIANALASGPELQAQATELTQAMVAYQVSTLYTLGDGSHRVATFKPETALV
jgi:hypothetical protein